MQFTLALDWTPNPIHTGFFVAQAKGWYQEAGIDVVFRSPETDNYQALPADLVAEGKAQLAICPSEQVIQSHYLGGGGKLMAIAAVLQGSASAFATLGSSGIERPSQLEGKRYAFLDLPFEETILQQLIYMDGGTGITTNIETAKLLNWYRLLQQDADCAWVFKPIEGVEAEHKGMDLNLFDPHAYGIPYGYAPVLVTSQELVKEQGERLHAFVQATARGYHFAAENPKDSTDLLLETAEFLEKPDKKLFRKMQEAVNQYYLTLEGHWGPMTADRWHGFIEWLQEMKCLTITSASPSHMRGTLQEAVFTNRFAEKDWLTQV